MIVKGNNEGTPIQIKATSKGELQTIAIVESELEHASESGEAFAWPSLNSDIDAGDTRLFIKNTGDKILKLSHAEFNPANVACTYDIGIGNATTTPTGTVVNAVNLNQIESSKTEDYLAYDDETAVADATKMFGVTVNTTDSKRIDLQGIILGKGHYIQINQETESTSGQVTVFGLYEDGIE